MYEEHFADGKKELVAIRESIRLDSALGRALVSILPVFAQMEREATGERTREAIAHIRRQGFHLVGCRMDTRRYLRRRIRAIEFCRSRSNRAKCPDQSERA